MADSSAAKNFEFQIINQWNGYNSANDKTNIALNIYVQGSENMYKKLNGNVSARPGLLRIGDANSTFSPVSSEFIWNTSWGATLPIWVTNNTLQVRYNGTWYTLQSGLTKTRYVFDKWFDPTQAKDNLLFVNGTSNLFQWTGGITDIASGNNSSGAIAQLASMPTNAGSGYAVGDILNITTGGTGATAQVTALGTGAILTASISGQPGQAGLNYKVGDVLQLVGGNLGSGGSVTVTAIGSGGAITTISITTSGIGFAAGLSYNTVGGGGTGAVITVNTVSTSGSITQLELILPGSGYTTGTGKAISGGTGTGATVNIVTIATGSITKSDLNTTFQQNGFSSSGVIIIAGVDYTYLYNTGVSLVGITPDPTGVTGVGLQKVIIFPNTPGVNFSSDFLKVINNQVYIGSYKSRLCYISSDTDYTNYVVPTPRVAGSPELLTLDSTLNGIGVRQGNAYISIGSGEWAVVSFTDITVGTTLTQQTNVDIKPVAKLAAAYAHEFIGNEGDNIIYLAKDQQVRTFGDFNDSFVAAYPSLSQEISTELMAENFIGGGLKCIGDFTYITAPVSGKTYLYQVRQAVDANNQVVVERVWHSPFVWNATRIDEINGTVVAFSNANPQVYQTWDTNQWHDDSPSDEPLPYSCVLALSYNSNGRRQGLQSFDKTFTEGYMTEGTLLNLTINYNYEGSTNQITVPINSINQPAQLFGASIGSLGDSSMGDKPLGDEIADETTNQNLPKFKVIKSLALVNCFEYQLIYSSDTADAQWEILASGTNAKIEAEQNASFIINKPRN